jgi:HEAT repeat protein
VKRKALGEDGRNAANGQHRDELEPFGRRRLRGGVPRWIAVVGCCFLVFWACLRLYDHQHPAARAARGLWSPQRSDRLAAIRDLEGSGRVDTEVAIPALISALQDTDVEVRAAAATALVSAIPGVAGAAVPSGADVRATVEALVKSLEDRQPAMRAAATRALWMVILVNQVPAGQLDLEPAINAVIERLDDPDPTVRLSAIQGLGAVGPKVLGDPPAKLVAAMDDASEKSRDAATEALAVFYQGLPRVIPSLVKSAEGATPAARDGYLKLLSRIRPRSFSSDAVPGLITALESRNGEIVAVAASDLLAFADTVPYPVGSPTQSAVRSAVRPLIAALNQMNETQVNDAITSDPVVAIAKALGRLAPETPLADEGMAALASVLRAGDSNSRRRIAAATALGGFHAATRYSLP